MSSIPRTTAVRRNLQYIAVAELRNEVFEYSTSLVGFKTVGTFTAPFASDGTRPVSIPAGTLLVETGRKLFRGANPNVPTFLVQVMAYTPGKATDGGNSVGNGQSLRDGNGKAVSGFIDPNSPDIAIYSIDRNSDQDDGLFYSNVTLLNAGGAATTVAQIAAAGGVPHRGPSLFTGGSLTAGGSTTVIPVTSAAYTSSTGLTVYTAANSLVAGQIVTITGAGTASAGSAVYNLTNAVILSADATTFTIRQVNGLTNSTSTGGTATAIQVGINVAAGGVSVAAGGLTINGGPVTQKKVALVGTVIDLKDGNMFTQVTSVAGPSYTMVNSVPGMIFYLILSNAATAVTSIGITGATVSTQAIASGGAAVVTCIVT